MWRARYTSGIRAMTLAIVALLAAPLSAHDISAGRAAIEGVWIGADAGVALPDISNIRAAGRRVMDEYVQAQDGVLNCLIDWGRLNTVSGFPLEIITGDSQVTILHEYNHAVRRVFLDRDRVSARLSAESRWLFNRPLGRRFTRG